VTCTASDQCHLAGNCEPTTGQCSNPPASQGTTCTDSNLCDVNPVCDGAGHCAGTAKTCAASDQCHLAGTCDPGTGQCSNPTAPDGTTCSDNNPCTGGETCQAGSCGKPTTLSNLSFGPDTPISANDPFFGVAVLGDFNGDGKLDFAGIGSNGNGILLGNGDGTFRPQSATIPGAPSSIPVVADFNGDGKLDLAFACDDDEQAKYGGISVALGNGNGTFQTAHYYDLGQGPFTNVVADYNNDGKLDIMTMYAGTNLVTLLPGNGDGTFATAKTYGFGATDFNASFAAADFNEDGNLDVATGGCCNSLSVVEGYGDFAFTGVLSPMVDSGGAVLVAIDFDGDGLVDIASADSDAGGGFEINAVRNLSH
jgi:uncharacterized protein (DUF2141 family)